MLVGAYPFEDPEDPRNFRKTIGVSIYIDCLLLSSAVFLFYFILISFCLWQRILSVHYSFPDYVRVSMECKHLLSRIFVANPERVILLSLN